jgi:hypothetical protein
MPVPAASVPCSPWSLTRSTLPAATWSSVRVVVPEPDDPADPDPDDPEDPEDPEDGDDAWVHGDDDCLGGEDDVDVDSVHPATPTAAAIPQATSPTAFHLMAPPPCSAPPFPD